MKTIEKLQQELQALLPMKEADKQRYDQKFMLDFNYNSNHLEGNTLTYGQTKLLFMFDETNGSANLKDYEEMKAHNVGLKMVENAALDKERPLLETFIRNLNETILVRDFQKLNKDKTGTYTIHVGVYKTRPNSVITATGEVFDYASPEETPALMQALIDWYRVEEQKKELNPIELAALLHYRYIRIHPFEDGNGRIARLLVNYVLLRHNLPMLVIRTDDKENYLRILHQCDVQVGLTPNDGANAALEQIQPFVEYLKEQEINALELVIKAAKGESVEEPEDFEKRIKLLERQVSQDINNKQDNAINILYNIIIPLKTKIEKSLNIVDFYTKKCVRILVGEVNRMKEIDDINQIEVSINNFFQKTGSIEGIILDFELRELKETYQKLLPLNIYEKVTVEFEKTSFKLFANKNSKEFEYGTYPTEEELNEIANQIKTEILKQIETAINKSKPE
ncbi:MAG: Fic family protein [Prevotellaceae bacterium]|jgi:Fic family protein|nr:Fic family protein [Prevotellaceae bacterium]